MESTKQPWEPMQLTYVGHVAEIVQGRWQAQHNRW